MVFEERYGSMIDLDEALARLERESTRAAQLVELRYFADCSMQEAADILGISKRSAERDWKAVKAFLAKELG